jgi:hypothetical protein
MGTVPPDELARLWAGEQLPVEMATGQILQHLVRMQATLEAHGRLLDSLRSDVDYLLAAAATKPPTPTKRSRQRQE